MTSDYLDLKCVHRKLRHMVLRSVPSASYADFALFVSIHDTVITCDKAKDDKLPHSDFDLTRDIISDHKVSNVGFPSIKFLGLSSAV